MNEPAPDFGRGAARVAAAARDLGLEITVVAMPASTRTAEEAAAACGCSVGEIVKSLVFRGRTSGRPYLLLVAGSNRVDEKAVAGSIGEAPTRAAADDVRAITGYAIGGIPPFGHATALTVFIDEDLLGHGRVWAAAGTPFAVFAVDPRALATAVGATVIRMG
ncbi:MAG: YbaK/EbsC family protein [Siculibacillus sp.]|nr:YbaK/EbsC family protein [Siculibacillus sp.]